MIKNPQTFNRYSYALNSPYKFVDPLGLAAMPGGCAAVSSGSRTNPVQGACQTREDTANQQNQQSSQTPGNESNVSIKRNSDVYYDVNGADASSAMANADSRNANANCDSGYAGCTATTMTASIGTPGFRSKPKAKGGYQVTENSFDPEIEVTATVYLPNWTGYSSASKTEQDAWDKSIAGLKDHEEGHVQIAIEEANRTGKELKASLPTSRTFSSKSGDEATIKSVIRNRYAAANKVVSDGFTRYKTRDRNYDAVTIHGQIPRSQVIY